MFERRFCCRVRGQLNVAAAIFGLSGCGPSADTDAGTAVDAAMISDTSFADAAPESDAGTSVSIDAGSAAVSMVLAQFGAASATLDHGVYGYERTGGTVTGLYLEVHRGGTDGCPTMSSPTPDQTLIVSGINTQDVMQSVSGSVRIAFLDFTGLVRSDVRPATATSGTLQLGGIELGGGALSGMLMGTFADGSVSGAFQAVHCDSLDQNQ